jgi:ATP-dependent DNA helicase PIF1
MGSRDQTMDEIKSSFNAQQQEVFDQCISGNDSVFCTGQGGTGKSWLLECIVRHFRESLSEDGGLLAVTASTGIAAFLIKGITLHKFAGVGIEETNLTTMIQRASRGLSKTYWKDTSILIIDEVSMISATFFENLSLLAKNLRNSSLPFGGIRLIMFGDFLQLPPISKVDHPTVRIFHTDAWQELSPKVMELKQIVRQTNPEFIKILSEMRYGMCTDETEAYIRGLEREIVYDDGIEPVRLFAKKDSTEAHNVLMLSGLSGRPVRYKSIDSGDVGSLKQCPAVQNLELKEGCQVMVIRNLGEGVVNGSVGTIVGFEANSSVLAKKPRVRVTLPNGDLSTISVGRTAWETIAPNGKVLATRIQFPLILAWAVTIHKSQGQTLSRVSVDMSGIFEVGQAYVAMSRCKDPSNLRVVNFNRTLVMVAQSCVKFYQELSEGPREPSVVDDDLPKHSEEGATSVADVTQRQWDNTIVQHPLMHESGLDTQIMLGNLSLQQTSSSSSTGSTG